MGRYNFRNDVKDYEQALTIHDVRAFRNKIPLGTRVRFQVRDILNEDARKKKAKFVEGELTGKFAHVAVLDGKYTYTWKDMLLGGVEVIE